MRCAILACGILLASLDPGSVVAQDVIATVNGQPITQADFELEAVLRSVPNDELGKHRESLIDDLIDQRLIETFVARKRTKANPVQLEAQVERIHALIRRRGEEPAALFERLGLDEEQLRERLALSLAWNAYVQKVTTDQQLRAYFHQHRRELDGTQVQAKHILLKASPDDDATRKAARVQLAGARQQIIDGKTTFEEAATEHSQGPSAEQGGDVGFFPHRGTMSAEFADAAFGLKVGEVSEPVETPFGVHLITVTAERPGQLSLEDVRPQMLERISAELWSQQVARDRQQARIQRPPSS